MNPIKQLDAADLIQHSPEARLFATVLFHERPAAKIPLLQSVPDRLLSVLGRRVKRELMLMDEPDSMSVQRVFVGRGYEPPMSKWFFACMAAAGSTIYRPFELHEIGVI